MTTTHLDRPLEFTDTHRVDEDVQPTILDACHAEALDAITDAACDTIRTGAPLCSCRGADHAPTCPANPDPSVCDVCTEAYDPYTVPVAVDCPGGHCDDEACLCRACERGARS